MRGLFVVRSCTRILMNSKIANSSGAPGHYLFDQFYITEEKRYKPNYSCSCRVDNCCRDRLRLCAVDFFRRMCGPSKRRTGQ